MPGHSYSKKIFPDVQMELPVFQFVPITSGPVTGCHWREPVSIFAPTLQVFKHTGKLCVSSMCLPTHPMRFLLYRLNSPRPLSLFSYEMLQSLNHFSSPSFSSLCLSSTGELRTGPSTPHVASPVQSRREGSVPWACWWHSSYLAWSRMPLASFVTRAHCWLRLHLLSTRTPRAFFCKVAFQQLSSNPASANAWVCSSLGAALGTHLC